MNRRSNASPLDRRAATAANALIGDKPGFAAAILNAFPDPVFVVGDDLIQYVNLAGQDFLCAGESVLLGRRLDEHLPADSPVFAVMAQARADGATVSEYGVTLETPRIGQHFVTVQASPLPETPGSVVLSFGERSIARRIDHQLTHRGAARSVTGMAAMLAHEVKNPLSGIRGAAQLLEQSAGEADRELTRLICDEADRIVALVDRMEAFSDQRILDREPINIHAVLEHVRRVAQSGFARHVRFVERYDPSLPPVYGVRDQLVQVFLNLVKNAAEAAPRDGAEIVLSTAYRHGIRLATPGANERLHLPLLVAVQDNGDGVPEELRDHLFDPFVTTKVNGSGLGLAMVAKIVGDHGGVVEFDSSERGSTFKVSLPMAPAKAGDEAGV